MMKKTVISTLAALLLAMSANASVTLNGAALLNAPGLTAGQVGVFLVSTDGTPFDGGALDSLNAGLPLNDGATFGGAFAFAGTNTAIDFFGISLSSPGTPIDFAGGVNAGDQYGLVVFSSSTANTLPGDTYGIWTDPSWLLPADGSTISISPTLSSGPSANGVVIPEPSTYAMLAGALALVAVMIRRRR